MIELRTGDRCYYETVRDGLIACRVVSIGQWTAKLRVTGRTSFAYARGEFIDTTHLHAIPRAAVRRTLDHTSAITRNGRKREARPMREMPRDWRLFVGRRDQWQGAKERSVQNACRGTGRQTRRDISRNMAYNRHKIALICSL